MSSAVPTETVDDFLRSIGSAPPDDERPEDRSTFPDSQHQDVTMMDVDEIPGLQRSLSMQSSVSAFSQGPHDPPPTSASSFGAPPTSGDSATTVTTIPNRETSSEDEEQGQSLASLRRGGKRPVAADFVDIDVGPHGHRNGVSNGHTQPPGLLRRKKNASFASVSTMRRCVIDLSDSEGEGDGDVAMREIGDYENEGWGETSGSGYSSPRPARAPVVMNAIGASQWPAPPYGPTPGSSRTMSPAALMEKELEIQKMRQLIALREQGRVKKLTVGFSPRSRSNLAHILTEDK